MGSSPNISLDQVIDREDSRSAREEQHEDATFCLRAVYANITCCSTAIEISIHSRSRIVRRSSLGVKSRDEFIVDLVEHQSSRSLH